MKWFASAQTRFGFDAPPCTHISVGISRIGAQAARVCGRGPEDKSGHALDRCAVLATACWRNRENPSAFRGQQSLEHPIRRHHTRHSWHGNFLQGWSILGLLVIGLQFLIFIMKFLCCSSSVLGRALVKESAQRVLDLTRCRETALLV